jgi:hypothetical protein
MAPPRLYFSLAPAVGPQAPAGQQVLQAQLPLGALPPRSQVVQRDPLPIGFDLPSDMRGGLRTVICAVNQPNPLGPGRRWRWQPAHDSYLVWLMEYGVLTLNRRLERRDFPALLEALDRRFFGTPGYPVRGYNTVHTHGIRLPAYAAALRRLGF